MGKKKSNKAKVRHTEENRTRRIRAEINRCKQKLEALLKRGAEEKPGGVLENSPRHTALLDHIRELESKLK